jgi:hypothetical protein
MTWTGCYIGVNGGGAWMDGPSMTYVDLAAGNTFHAYAPSTINASSSSGLAGVHGGCNWQTASTWVFGIEGDWDWTNLNAGGTNRLYGATANNGATYGLLNDTLSMQTKVNWLASVRGRFGYASPNWMLYGTGGVAFADMGFNAAVNCNGPINSPGFSLCDAPGQNIRPIRRQLTGPDLTGLFGPGDVRELSRQRSLEMPEKWFSAEQIIVLLRQIEVLTSQGKTPAVACREAGVSQQF